MAVNQAGQKLIQLYYQRSSEVADILLKNPMLTVRSAAILREVMPGVKFMLGSKAGRDIIVSRLLVARIQRLFADISKEGSDELAVMLSELSETLDSYKGMRTSRIWKSMEQKQLMR